MLVLAGWPLRTRNWQIFALKFSHDLAHLDYCILGGLQHKQRNFYSMG
jgi:hypothetical protein